MAKQDSKVWFISDLHFKHENILKFSDRDYLGSTIEEHDARLIEMWNTCISKYDTIYILGDLCFGNIDDVKKLLQKLNGDKILVKGNHDKVSDELRGHYNQMTLIKKMKFKKTVYPFLVEDFEVVMCHYPMVSWESKSRGAVMVHGHCHGRIDQYNKDSKELRVDVGIDGELANGYFISLEKLYEHFCKIKGARSFREYSKSTLDVTED